MRALSVWGVFLMIGLIAPLEAQVEIFSDNLESGGTGAWSLDNSLCPRFFGGKTIAGHCYSWMEGSGDWYESQRQCGIWAPGAELVSVESASEWEFLLLNLEPTGFDSWLGLSRGVQDDCPGVWAWESGESVTSDDWDSGQPDEGSCPACAASWGSLDQRWDDLACDASGQVSDSICEVDLRDVRIVGKNGGRFLFPNGVILDVPADAVDQDTAIGLRALECSELEPFLNSRPMNSHDKECMAAVEVLPADVALGEPVTLTLPVGERQTGQIPVLVEVFPEESDYAYRPTDLLHDPASEILQLSLTSLGQYAVVGLSEPSISPPGQLEGKSTNIPCDELRVGIRSEFVDLDVKYNEVECTLLFDSVSVTFLDCEGSPTFLHEIAESVGCSDETYFLGRICGPDVSGDECFAEPQPVTYVPAEDSVRLHNWIQAYDPEQGHRTLFTANIDHATYQWQSLDFSMGKFPDPGDGTLQTEKCPEEPCRFNVQALNRYVSSPLPKGTVEVVSTIFDVEWSYSWSNDRMCTQSEPKKSSNIFERNAGNWGGTATFAIPDYNVSEALAWQLVGSIEYFRDADVTLECDGYVVGWKEIDQFDWSSSAPCTKEDFGLYIDPNEQDAQFWACMPPVYDAYEFRSGSTCNGPLNVERNWVGLGVPCLFPVVVDLSHTDFGVFEANETLLLEPFCGFPCAGVIPVSVSVRAVYRQPNP